MSTSRRTTPSGSQTRNNLCRSAAKTNTFTLHRIHSHDWTDSKFCASCQWFVPKVLEKISHISQKKIAEVLLSDWWVLTFIQFHVISLNAFYMQYKIPEISLTGPLSSLVVKAGGPVPSLVKWVWCSSHLQLFPQVQDAPKENIIKKSQWVGIVFMLWLIQEPLFKSNRVVELDRQDFTAKWTTVIHQHSCSAVFVSFFGCFFLILVSITGFVSLIQRVRWAIWTKNII